MTGGPSVFMWPVSASKALRRLRSAIISGVRPCVADQQMGLGRTIVAIVSINHGKVGALVGQDVHLLLRRGQSVAAAKLRILSLIAPHQLVLTVRSAVFSLAKVPRSFSRLLDHAAIAQNNRLSNRRSFPEPPLSVFDGHLAPQNPRCDARSAHKPPQRFLQIFGAKAATDEDDGAIFGLVVLCGQNLGRLHHFSHCL